MGQIKNSIIIINLNERGEKIVEQENSQTRHERAEMKGQVWTGAGERERGGVEQNTGETEGVKTIS